MDLAKQIVVEIPVYQLWTSQRVLDAKRGAYLTKAEIRDILRTQPVAFAIANVGDKLNWVSLADCYIFWKSEVQSHVVDNLKSVILEKFPGEYAFIASKWVGEEIVIILLEKIH